MITKVKYTDLDHTQVNITLDDGREMFAGVSGATWLHTELREWFDAGGTIDPIDPPSVESILTTLTNAVQEHLDATARERNYDGILSLCTYATSTNIKFAAEGQAGVTWRDAVWAKCYEIMDEVISDTRPIPTKEELISLLPTFTWPV